METVGYSARCKVCNNAHRSEIERWVREGLSYRLVSEKLKQEHNEIVSYNSIKRHMVEHFDVKSSAREKYIKDQREKSKSLMDEETNKLLSEVEMVDQVARKSHELYLASHSWLMKLVSEEGKIPLSLVSVAKMSSEELRQQLKQKQELLGESKEEEKMDLADVLTAAWEQMQHEQSE